MSELDTVHLLDLGGALDGLKKLQIRGNFSSVGSST